MRKIVFSLVALMTLFAQSYSQNDNGYIGVSLGASIPMGDFSSKDIDNSAAGWANTGAVFDISFAYKLGEGNFGITALLRGQANPIDAQGLADELANQVPGVLWTIDTDQWVIGGLLFGGFGSFPVSEKTSFDTRAMIGFLNADLPAITRTGSDVFGTTWFKQGNASATSFAYLIGLGLRFEISNRLCLLTNLDYLGSNPEFVNVEYTSSDGSRFTDTWSQSMGTLNFSAGIALKI